MSRVLQAIWSAIRGIVRCIYGSYRLGGRMFRVAPGIVAIAALPELAQHVVEIRIGMFDSVGAAHALANDPLRWGFGYAKIAGLVLGMLFTARYWARGGSAKRALLISPPVLLRTGFALAVMIAIGVAGTWLDSQLPPAPRIALSIVTNLLLAGALIWVVAELFEDRSISLRQGLTTHLPTAILMLLLFFAAMMPAQLLHQLDHKLALGQPEALVWGLMLFDSLVVGLIAALVGSAIYVGFRAGPTWRGWTRPPGS